MPSRSFVRNALASEASLLRARGPVDRSVSITQLSPQRRTGFLIVFPSSALRRTVSSDFGDPIRDNNWPSNRCVFNRPARQRVAFTFVIEEH